jgi:hypothetical protein
LTWELLLLLLQSLATAPEKLADGAVMVCEINEVNDWPVGKPQEQGVMNIAASFSLSKKQGYQSSRRETNDQR